ncbi:hypothetical protein [Janthinobacterium agaricidamnosum]|uniref:Uncharacterized protein n=1 Tax=Janthinobacterium agaricidamnosum NBRC 102515 = DSM 9628 TaxID=1349767 RepID=W0V4V8_9BURK|nr:hypothetical protein [Janthinobacterium agaricidamnosum]CDG82307.1 hypothetical protein GJA_1669 [Janthinobacterium agaricidamnosum NBRC 102515 = DSM 9628]
MKLIILPPAPDQAGLPPSAPSAAESAVDAIGAATITAISADSASLSAPLAVSLAAAFEKPAPPRGRKPAPRGAAALRRLADDSISISGDADIGAGAVIEQGPAGTRITPGNPVAADRIGTAARAALGLERIVPPRAGGQDREDRRDHDTLGSVEQAGARSRRAALGAKADAADAADAALYQVQGRSQDDGVFYLAMAGITVVPPLRSPVPSIKRGLPAVAPQSRAQCIRFCNRSQGCDPSSALGCGGRWCVDDGEV